MSKELVDVTIHVDEAIDSDQQKDLMALLRETNGVISVGHQQKVSHLFIIEYDPDVVTSEVLLEVVGNTGVHAELIGL